ncbi:MAG: type III-A CRISPR-associated RAMP protein Csm3 [Defluviitaleaceae bacterium]|nr:type III-A CRISPR-associated RAMP protein Csm3 [Defluviitaleaceae bacterium]
MKILITGEIEIVTGMHIGGSEAFSAIGAVDSPVVRDPLTKHPIIPGSSLKGKMRYLLSKEMANGIPSIDPNKDELEILRLFGSSEKNNIKRARLKFNDCFFKNLEELKKRGTDPTEIKFENTINRKTAVAMPRQIERVISGSKFSFDLFYNIDKESLGEVIDDFDNIKRAFDLLEYDYLGGHGTRGSGRIRFNDLVASNVIGNYEDINKLNEILSVK